MTAKKGQWVQIHNIVLKPEERAAHLPEDTKRVPLEMWVKGRLAEDAEIGSVCTIETPTGRQVTGTLCEAEPGYTHGFGEYVEELTVIREQVKGALS